MTLSEKWRHGIAIILKRSEDTQTVKPSCKIIKVSKNSSDNTACV